MISHDEITMIAQYVAAHVPEGVLPMGLSCTPSTSTYADLQDDPGYWSHLREIKICNNFVEMTGDIEGCRLCASADDALGIEAYTRIEDPEDYHRLSLTRQSDYASRSISHAKIQKNIAYDGASKDRAGEGNSRKQSPRS